MKRDEALKKMEKMEDTIKEKVRGHIAWFSITPSSTGSSSSSVSPSIILTM
jgi:hypothetical protein